MSEDFDEILRIQKMINESTRRELQEDRLSELMALIGSLITSDKKKQIEEIFYTCIDKGYSEKEIRDVLNKYIKDRVLYQPSPGYIQRR